MAKTKAPTVEEILLSIREEIEALHGTVGQGLLSINEALLTIAGKKSEGGVAGAGPLTEGERRSMAAEEKHEAAGSPSTPADDGEIPKFIREYVATHPGCKPADLVKEFGISANRARKAIAEGSAGAAEPEKITVEMLRAKISEFAEAFSMNDALALNEQFGGSRKVSGIPEEKYAAVYHEMQNRLTLKADVAKANEKQAAKEKVAGLPTIEDVREVAGPFVKKYGDPAFRELLAKFVKKGDEVKISKVPAASYPALIEALANA